MPSTRLRECCVWTGSPDCRIREISSNPSISGMPTSRTRTCGLTSAMRSSAVNGELIVVTSAPAVSSTTRRSVSASSSSSTASTRTSLKIAQTRQRLAALGARVFAPLLDELRVHGHQRQPNAERRALVFAGARRLHRPAVHLDDVANDGQAESEAAGLSCRARLGLAETLEHVLQEVGMDAHARVAHDNLDMRVHAFEANLHAAMLGRELHRIRHEIPDDLLQAAWIAGHRSDARDRRWSVSARPWRRRPAGLSQRRYRR